jgi:hypothetical protein
MDDPLADIVTRRAGEKKTSPRHLPGTHVGFRQGAHHTTATLELPVTGLVSLRGTDVRGGAFRGWSLRDNRQPPAHGFYASGVKNEPIQSGCIRSSGLVNTPAYFVENRPGREDIP